MFCNSKIITITLLYLKRGQVHLISVTFYEISDFQHYEYKANMTCPNFISFGTGTFRMVHFNQWINKIEEKSKNNFAKRIKLMKSRQVYKKMPI